MYAGKKRKKCCGDSRYSMEKNPIWYSKPKMIPLLIMMSVYTTTPKPNRLWYINALDIYDYIKQERPYADLRLMRCNSLDASDRGM
jgi:hypothetical protein